MLSFSWSVNTSSSRGSLLFAGTSSTSVLPARSVSAGPASAGASASAAPAPAAARPSSRALASPSLPS